MHGGQASGPRNHSHFLITGRFRALSRVKKAPAKVIGEPITKIEDVVFDGHDFAVISAAVGWATEAPADHLHVKYWTEDWSRNQDQVCLWCVESSRQDAMIADHPKVTRTKPAGEVLPGKPVGLATDRSRWTACEV